jgi:hypothetical protein
MSARLSNSARICAHPSPYKRKTWINSRRGGPLTTGYTRDSNREAWLGNRSSFSSDSALSQTEPWATSFSSIPAVRVGTTGTVGPTLQPQECIGPAPLRGASAPGSDSSEQQELESRGAMGTSIGSQQQLASPVCFDNAHAGTAMSGCTRCSAIKTSARVVRSMKTSCGGFLWGAYSGFPALIGKIARHAVQWSQIGRNTCLGHLLLGSS